MRIMSVASLGALLCVPVAAIAAQNPAPATANASAQNERRICRSTAATGSFARRTRTCLTVDQWRRADEGNRDLAREMQENNRGRPGEGG